MTNDLIRDFKGIWIPKEIWLDERLNTIDKIILLEIDSLDATEEGCYASNKYLAEFCKCTETTISTSISKLIKLEYLELVKFDGRKRYLKSSLSKIENQTLKNLKADFKKFKDINIDNNITNNKKEINKERFKKPTLKDVEKYCKERNNGINPQTFIDFYESKGWLIGKSPMKDWKACVRTWEKRKVYGSVKVEPLWYEEAQDIKIISKQEQEEMDDILKEIGE